VVPADILDYLVMGFPRHHWVDCWRQLVRLAHVPHTNHAVVRTRQQVTLSLWVPVESIALLTMAKQTEIRLDFFSVAAAVFEVIEDVDLARNRLGRDDLVLLRHVSSAVDLSLMVNLQLNLDAFVSGNVLSSECGSSAARCTSSAGIAIQRIPARIADGAEL